MQKKKIPLFILACIPCFLIGLWAIGRLTGAIQFYTIPTPGNEPTIKTGAYVIGSNLKIHKGLILLHIKGLMKTDQRKFICKDCVEWKEMLLKLGKESCM